MLVRFFNSHFPILLARMRFRKLFHKKLDLKNPKDINEKILYLSLLTDTSKWSELTDKYSVRKYVKDCGLEDTLVSLYGKWDKPEDINWGTLPNSFVLKTNNGSGTVMLVNDKSSLNVEGTVAILKAWLDKKIGDETSESHYKKIKPCIIAEELLVQLDEEKTISTSLIDYKIWCFNGKAHSIWVCTNRCTESVEVASYDLKWNYHPEHSIFNDHYRKSKKLMSKPKNLQRLIDVAEILAKPFPEVRVDLYYINNCVFFGEMTFTSFGGTMNFYTPDFLLEMGSLVDINYKG